MENMKHTFRNVVVASLVYLGVATLYRWYVSRNGPLVRVLCFHDVPDAVWFRSVLKLIVDEFRLITPKQFHAKDFDGTKINILLTFDDGYKSWVDVCLPILEAFEAKGIFFINSGLLNVAHDEAQAEVYMHQRLLLSHAREPLSWGGAERLVKAGQTIGGHTVNHVRASSTSPEVWADEVIRDRADLESKLRVHLDNFAFPFGRQRDMTASTQEIVTKNGYSTSYSAETGFYTPRDILVPRTLLTPGQSVRQVRAWVLGGYDVLKVSVR